MFCEKRNKLCKNMRYCCESPGCSYQTNTKSHINTHHIIPRELGGTNAKWNLIKLCPSCHSHIYVPDSKHGNHMVKGEDSIILHGWRMTTGGKMLEYTDKDGVLKYWKREKAELEFAKSFSKGCVGIAKSEDGRRRSHNRPPLKEELQMI